MKNRLWGKLIINNLSVNVAIRPNILYFMEDESLKINKKLL